jgi:5'-deoxynucleotidase YfbR-like HD superfamily hydrolase|tara:strand:- start:7 stop:348 length:342 start_codon:yes stop_codon:yes gene_type:complete
MTNERYKENAEIIRKSCVEIVQAAKPFVKKAYDEINDYWTKEKKIHFIRDLYDLAISDLPETEKFDQAYSNLIRVIESSTASNALKITSGLENSVDNLILSDSIKETRRGSDE